MWTIHPSTWNPSECKDFLSLKGCRGRVDRDSCGRKDYVAICKSIDKWSGRYVRNLAIPFFLELDDRRSLSMNCPDLVSLDSASLMQAT